MRANGFIVMGCAPFFLAGCMATQDVARPSDITLENALVDTVDALAAAKARGRQKNTHMGFYGCSVTAVFNVTASATDSRKLALTASGPPVAIFPVTLGGSASTEATASGSRANTVTVVLGTKYCLLNAKASEVKAPGKPGKKSDEGEKGDKPGGEIFKRGWKEDEVFIQ